VGPAVGPGVAAFGLREAPTSPPRPFGRRRPLAAASWSPTDLTPEAARLPDHGAAARRMCPW